ncbi:MarR family transcriptional regulator [Pseudoalteromonas sp. MSK9-3]|nr:MarR family transcriptional regulator [Pseudoalteromonas sp. MSK9-3]
MILYVNREKVAYVNNKTLLNINEFLPYQLVALSSKVSEDFSHVYIAHGGLTQAQWRVLAHVANTQGLGSTAKQICELANMDKSTVSRAIKQLEEKALIRLTQHENDKRAMVVTVTDAGCALYQDITPKALDWESELLSCLQDDEQKQLKTLISKLSNYIVIKSSSD